MKTILILANCFFRKAEKYIFLTTKVGLHAVVVLSVKTLDRRKLGYLVVFEPAETIPSGPLSGRV